MAAIWATVAALILHPGCVHCVRGKVPYCNMTGIWTSLALLIMHPDCVHGVREKHGTEAAAMTVSDHGIAIVDIVENISVITDSDEEPPGNSKDLSVQGTAAKISGKPSKAKQSAAPSSKQSNQEKSKHISAVDKQLLEMMTLRDKWQGHFHKIREGKGVMLTSADICMKDIRQGLSSLHPEWSLKAFNKDLETLEKFHESKPLVDYAVQRLQAMRTAQEAKSSEHAAAEKTEMKELPKDYMSGAKADNHIHHSAAMSQQHLLQFISSVLSQSHHVDAIRRWLTKNKKLKPEEKKSFEDIVERAKVSTLTLASLDVFAHDETFNKFDVFNKKYSPFRLDFLRDVFLKPSTIIDVSFPDGKKLAVRYMGDLTIDVCRILPTTYFPEWRISIYGRSDKEWSDLNDFFSYRRHELSNELWYGLSHEHVRIQSGGSGSIAEVCARQVKWIVQVPRIFHLPIFEQVGSFGKYLENIFMPLFRKTPAVEKVLEYISGMDSVDDETQDHGLREQVSPDQAKWIKNASNKNIYPFSYYMYFMAIGVTTMNLLHGTKLTFRPHCGEGGSTKHLLVCYLIADGIQHGVTLHSTPLMQYMYYLGQVPVSMSISSNHFLTVKQDESPFGQLFNLGLFITLSSDDPLIFFEEAEEEACLMSDYYFAEKLFELSWVDLAEVAFNSVMMSGYDNGQKAAMLGIEEKMIGEASHWPEPNSVTSMPKTGVPMRRISWRMGLWQEEICRFAPNPIVSTSCTHRTFLSLASS